MPTVTAEVCLEFQAAAGLDLTGAYVGVAADLFDRHGNLLGTTRDVASLTTAPAYDDPPPPVTDLVGGEPPGVEQMARDGYVLVWEENEDFGPNHLVVPAAFLRLAGRELDRDRAARRVRYADAWLTHWADGWCLAQVVHASMGPDRLFLKYPSAAASLPGGQALIAGHARRFRQATAKAGPVAKEVIAAEGPAPAAGPPAYPA